VPEYKSSTIGPYLALVAANVVMGKKPELALQYFDWARLVLPGTIVEEAALRRSLIITVKQGNVEQSARFARLYLSRFPNSPYAAQVAGQVVTLIDMHHEQLGRQRISELLELLDRARQQEVYLRIARKSAVSGAFEFAHWAAGQALELSDGKADNPAKLAELYLSLSSVPTGNIAEVQSAFAKLPDEMLGPDERRLRDAGAFILSEVEKPASLESLRQAPVATSEHDKSKSKPAKHPPANAAHAGADASKPADAAPEKDGTDTFLSDGHAQLKAIDELMKKGDM
jgi:chemotaxis protein MotC